MPTGGQQAGDKPGAILIEAEAKKAQRATPTISSYCGGTGAAQES